MDVQWKPSGWKLDDSSKGIIGDNCKAKVNRKDKMHNSSTDTNILYILNTIYEKHICLHPFYFHPTNNLAYVLSINASYLSSLSLFLADISWHCKNVPRGCKGDTMGIYQIMT